MTFSTFAYIYSYLIFLQSYNSLKYEVICEYVYMKYGVTCVTFWVYWKPSTWWQHTSCIYLIANKISLASNACRFTRALLLTCYLSGRIVGLAPPAVMLCRASLNIIKHYDYFCHVIHIITLSEQMCLQLFLENSTIFTVLITLWQSIKKSWCTPSKCSKVHCQNASWLIEPVLFITMPEFHGSIELKTT